MNRLLGLVSAGVWFAVVTATSGRAQTPAVVSGDRLNVRSRPSLSGEVVTQLAHGQVVTVLDEGWRAPGATNAASEWVRIELPALTHVWVSAEFVDSTAGTVKPKRLNVRAGPGEEYGVLGALGEGTAVRKVGEKNGWVEIEAPTGLSAYVAASYLQKVGATSPAVAAPGAEKPASTLPAATVPEPTITPPPQPETTNAAAQPPAQPAPTTPPPAPAETEARPPADTTPAIAVTPATAPAESVAEKAAPTAEPPPTEQPKEIVALPLAEKTVAETAAPSATEKQPVENAASPAEETASPKPITPAPDTSKPVATNVTAALPPAATTPSADTAAKPSEPVVAETTASEVTETVPAPAAPAPAEVKPALAPTEATPPADSNQPASKRVVRREGTVRATISFQAPTPFELRAPDTGATMDYLLPASTNINIKTFWGARVIVTGQEAIDSRWPKTPVIKVEKIELAP